MALEKQTVLDCIRVLLGDQQDDLGNCQFSDAQLTAALDCVFRMGFAPCCYSLDDDGCITPEPSGSGFGIITMQAALWLRGGMTACSYRTRALSVSQTQGSLDSARNWLYLQISQIKSRGGACSSPGCTCEYGGAGGDGLFSCCDDFVTKCRNSAKLGIFNS